MNRPADCCEANYDFDKVIYFARKKFIDQVPTIELLQSAKTDKEREEICLISLLEVEDAEVRDLLVECKYQNKCSIVNCQQVLKKMIEKELQREGSSS